MAFSRMTRYAAIAAAAALALAGCARADDDTGGTTDNGGGNTEDSALVVPGVHRQDDGGDPTPGGTLTFADYAETRSLDPTKTIATGSSGGTALVAVYSQLLRHNPETDAYEPVLAETVEPNDEFTEWTVKLREGVQFSDGSDLNADAVLGSVAYYLQNQGYDLGVIYPMWEGIEKVDDMTVVFKLNGGWATFHDFLGRGMGFIVAPAAIANGPDAFEPIGAGAFTLDNYAPGESMTLQANPNYFEGAPHIETLRFVWLGTDDTRAESFTSGTINAGYIRNPVRIKELREAGTPGVITVQNAGNILMLNAAEGKPFANEKARKALALALDPTLIYDRAQDGEGFPGKSLFSTESRWFDDSVELNDYDLEAAQSMLEEAKAEGYDGVVNYTAVDSPSSREEALVIQAQLEAAGFTVNQDFSRSVADYTSKVFIERSYDVGKAAVQPVDYNPYSGLYSVLHSQSAANVLSNNDPELDALLDELRETPVEEAADVITRIEERYQEAVPMVSIGTTLPFLFWGEDVHGIIATNEDMVDFSKAWIQQ